MLKLNWIKSGYLSWLRRNRLSRRANLIGANLRGADLTGADLRHVDLRSANLSRANLIAADLRGADLTGANLTSVDFTRADFTGADLTGADLSRANLTGADLSSTNLSSADLRGATLRGADLSHADLSGAKLTDADLTNARLPSFQISRDLQLTVWKKLRDESFCKLLIPAAAKRTASLVSRKCRAEYAVVLDGGGQSSYDDGTCYVTGEEVRPDSYDDDIRVDCSHGIHFFLTREEAEEYEL